VRKFTQAGRNSPSCGIFRFRKGAALAYRCAAAGKNAKIDGGAGACSIDLQKIGGARGKFDAADFDASGKAFAPRRGRRCTGQGRPST